MQVVAVYWESVFDEFRLEAHDCNNNLVVNIDPKRVEKVDSKFEATL